MIACESKDGIKLLTWGAERVDRNRPKAKEVNISEYIGSPQIWPAPS